MYLTLKRTSYAILVSKEAGVGAVLFFMGRIQIARRMRWVGRALAGKKETASEGSGWAVKEGRIGKQGKAVDRRSDQGHELHGTSI